MYVNTISKEACLKILYSGLSFHFMSKNGKPLGMVYDQNFSLKISFMYIPCQGTYVISKMSNFAFPFPSYITFFVHYVIIYMTRYTYHLSS